MSHHLDCYRPRSNDFKAFPGQSPNEQVILMLRKHWIIDIVMLIKMFLGSFWPFIVYGIALIFFTIPNTIYLNLFVVALHIYSLFALFFYYVKWIDHRFDLIIVTDKRIVDINQYRLFNRKVSEANLAQVQDVASEVKGILGSILHYGTISIQTAGADGHIFGMDYIRWPSLVVSTIIELRSQYTRSHNKDPAESSH